MVLLDIWMPDCDGITLLKEWAKNGQLNIACCYDRAVMPALTPRLKPLKSARSIFWKNPIALQKLLSAVERALKHGEVQTASGMTLDKLGNSFRHSRNERQS